MKINPRTGQVTLSGGFTFDSTLTQETFVAQGLHDPARVHKPSTPWYYHPFPDGTMDGCPLEVSLCFYRNVLVSFTFYIDLHPPGTKSWDDYSEATEAAMQERHTALLARWFGPPHQQTPHGPKNKEFPALSTAIHYGFPWGHVGCSHDERSGSTHIVVRYPKNDEWARADYEKYRRAPDECKFEGLIRP